METMTSSNGTSLLATAEQYHSYGLNPKAGVLENGIKKPKGTWAKWQIHRMPIEYVRTDFYSHKSGYIGFITGKGSGGVEVIDVDCKHDKTGTLWNDLENVLKDAFPDLLGKLVIETTPSGGYHVFYKCPEATEFKDQDLAHNEDGETLIEQTKFIMTAPSPGYKLIQNDFSKIPDVSVNDRDRLIELARGFNRYKTPVLNNTKVKTTTSWQQIAVFTDYDKKHDYKNTLDLLTDAGYTIVGTQISPEATTIKRPGDTAAEHSGYVYHDSGNLYMFSTSASEFEANRSYKPSEVFTQLKHGGDQQAAYEELKNLDYGNYSGSDKISFIKSYISQHYNIRFNELTNDYELDDKPIEDRDLNSIYLAIAEAYKKANPKTKSYISKGMTQDIIESEFTGSYNPLREFLEANQDRHCEGTISELAATIDSKTVFPEDIKITASYVEHFLTKWLVNMMATALDGTDNPLLLALLGKQGTGKTEFFRRLLPNPLKKYRAEHAIADDKDFYIAMSKNILIADDELSGKSKVETKALNKIMSKQDLHIRVPYGRKEMKLTRRASLSGTGNDLRVLFDINGNRRIIPVEVLSIDHDAYNAIDKTDLIVEAWKLYVQGFNYRLTGKDIEALNESTVEFEYNELEVEVCQEYLMKGTEEQYINKTNSGIKTLIESNTKHRLSPVKLGKALTHLGFERAKKKVHKKSMWVYMIHPDSKIIRLDNEQERHENRY